MRQLQYILLLLAGVTFAACGLQKEIPQIKTFDDIPYPFTVNKTELPGGIQVAYFDEGKGKKTIIFIHGLGSYAPAWKKNIAELSKTHRVIALDLPGYGKSSKGTYEASMTFYATVVKDLMETLNLPSALIGGHSMGGQIAMTMALSWPDKVDGLILVAPAGFETFTTGQKQWFREVLTPTAVKLTPAETVAENLAWNFYHMPDDATFMINDRLAMRDAEDFDAYCYIIPECVKGMVDQPVFDNLKDIQQPVLVIYGKQDNLIPNRFLNGGKTEDIANAGVAQLPNAELHMVDKAGHFVQFEKSEEVNQLINTWIGNLKK
ncbi:MAG: alpha/beta fold hydrolase [Saprospiraceae bacterium]|nr:alpha/beta fold hydrolase [Saprospiraceae bacterium]